MIESPLLEAVLAYAKLGIRSVPLHNLLQDGKTCSCQEYRDKNHAGPCPSEGKHPRFVDFARRASADEKQLRAWWRKWPDANVGIIGGKESGIWALDTDPRNGGDDSRFLMVSKHERLPYTMTTRTGGGGTHEYFLWPKGLDIPPMVQLDAGLEVVGQDHVIVAPPSLHKSGKRYFFDSDLGPDEQLPVAAPDFLLAIIRDKLQASASPAAHIGAQGGWPEADYVKIRKGCGWIAHCHEYGAHLSEPEWYAQLSIVGRCAGGAQLAQDLSSPHKGYTARDTAAKLERAIRDAGPVTCAKVRNALGGARFCEACPNAGKVKSPAVLGIGALAASPNRATPAAAENGDSRSRCSVADSTGAALERAAALPVIVVYGRELREEAHDCLAALRAMNSPPELFVQSGMLVEVVLSEKGRRISRPATDAAVRGRLTRAADFRKKTAKGHVPCFPPHDVVEDLLALPPGELGFPNLEGVVSAPIIRGDGSILVSPGYDHQSGLYYAPEPGFHLPDIAESPSSDHMDIARDLIDEMLADFPFAEDASKANVIAAALTPLMRPVIDGATPLFGFDAPQAGTGKSLLVDVISQIDCGTPAEMVSMPRDEEEMRKVLTMLLTSGSQIVCFDNVMRRLDSGDLAKVLTERLHADRIFRTHQKIVLPVRCTWFATGNNLRLGGDLPRRCCWIRLDAKTSRPFLRGGFKIADLKSWVSARRPELMAALLTLVRAWYAAGKPQPRQRPLGSFEAWSVAIGGVLQNAGIDGFMGNMAAFYEEADAEAVQWENFLQALAEMFPERPFRVDDLSKKLHERTSNALGGLEVSDEAEELRAALPDYLAEVADRDGFFRRRAGKLFAEHCGRRFGKTEVYLRRDGISHHAQMWAVAKGS